MKIMHLKNKRLWTTTFLSLTLLATAGTALAGFQYSPGDLLVGLRLNNGGTHELLVNAGFITNFLKLSAGQSLTVANLTQGLLTDAFPGGLNDLKFATFADTITGTIVVGSSNYPPHTLWMNDQAVELPALKQQLVDLKAADPETPVVVRVASDVDYQRVISVLDLLQQADITKVGLATDIVP
jgi:hypothetical protein